MKILLSKESMIVVALLLLLSLGAVASMGILVNAAVIKDPTVYIVGSGSVELTWKSGKSQTYSSDAYANFGGLDTVTIIPNHGWHISAVLIDGILQDILDEDGFSLIDIQVKNMIFVTFVENDGEDDVDLGSNVGAYPDPNVGLIFAYVEGEGWVYAETIDLEPPDAKSDSWNIRTTATFSGAVTIYLVCNLDDLPPPPFDPYSLRLLRTEEELARADVNSDGMVDGTDVSIVANANPNEYKPEYDLDNDGDVDDDDVNIVNNYNNQSVWEDITLQVVIDDDLVYVYGSTDHFSIFGVH